MAKQQSHEGLNEIMGLVKALGLDPHKVGLTQKDYDQISELLSDSRLSDEEKQERIATVLVLCTQPGRTFLGTLQGLRYLRIGLLFLGKVIMTTTDWVTGAIDRIKKRMKHTSLPPR